MSNHVLISGGWQLTLVLALKGAVAGLAVVLIVWHLVNRFLDRRGGSPPPHDQRMRYYALLSAAATIAWGQVEQAGDPTFKFETRHLLGAVTAVLLLWAAIASLRADHHRHRREQGPPRQ